MYSTDPAGEFREMQERYAGMADEQLEALASEAYQLTDIARDALRSEIRTRQLKLNLREAPEPISDIAPEREDFDPENLDLVEARRVWSRDEARSLMEVLLQAGVSCYLGPKNIENAEHFSDAFERGVQLKVSSFEWPRAAAALHNAQLEEEESADPEEYRCPNCKSDEIVFDELEKESEDQPDFQASGHWHCEHCGNKWTDDV